MFVLVSDDGQEIAMLVLSGTGTSIGAVLVCQGSDAWKGPE